MRFDQKEIVRNAAQSYLSESAPGSVDEFEVVFDSTYETLTTFDKSHISVAASPEDEAGLFDAIVAQQTLVAMSCVVAFAFVKAAMKYSIIKDLPPVFDKLEVRLSQVTGKPKMIKWIRQRVEGILQNL